MDDRRNPFEQIERMFDRMGGQFESEFGNLRGMGGSGVAVDLADRGDEFVVTADLPGYEKENIDVQLRGDQLHVAAERETSTEEEGSEDGRFIRRERQHKSASRTLTLPEEVREDGVSASYQNGVLTVHLPKATATDSGGHSIDIE